MTDKTTLNDIGVKVEPADYNSGNLHSVLTEITHAVEQLLINQTTHIIDLRAMPWSAKEQQQLEDYLGTGEVSVELNTLGRSHFFETSYSGVWIVTHYDSQQHEASKLIEICTLPEMIKAQYEDIQSSLERLKETVLND